MVKLVAEDDPLVRELRKLVYDIDEFQPGVLRFCPELVKHISAHLGWPTADAAGAERIIRDFVDLERANQRGPRTLAAAEFIGLREPALADPLGDGEILSPLNLKLLRGGTHNIARGGRPIGTVKNIRPHVDPSLVLFLGSLDEYLRGLPQDSSGASLPSRDESIQDRVLPEDRYVMNTDDQVGGNATRISLPRRRQFVTVGAMAVLLLLGVLIGQLTARTESGTSLPLPVLLISTGGQFGRTGDGDFRANLMSSAGQSAVEGRFEPSGPVSGLTQITGTLEVELPPQDPCPNLIVTWKLEADGVEVAKGLLGDLVLNASTLGRIPRDVRQLRLTLVRELQSDCAGVVQVIWHQPKLSAG